MLAGEILRLAAARFPDKSALIEGERQLTYREFDRAANRAANALIRLGLAKGSRIAIVSPNSIEFAILYFGAARAGVIAAMPSTRSTAQDLAYMLDKVGAEALFFSGALAATIGAARKSVATLKHAIALGPADGAAGPSISFESFMAQGDDAPPDVPLDLDDPLAMTFTGGTTGFPKGVLVTHRARYTTVVTCNVEFGLDERDIVLVATPMFHAAGLFVWFKPAVMLGCTCVLMGAWDVGQFIDIVERHAVTGTLLVPTQLADLVGDARFSAERLRTLRHINYAGAPMPVALFDRLRTALPDVAFTENYGQSETGPMTIRRTFHPYDKRTSVGRPAHNVETRVVDARGRDVPPGVVGEIVTRGAHLLKEYWGEPAQTAALFRSGDGWLWTGDLGMRDADGFISLVDRSKDMIIAGGENIYPAEIENALYQHEAVAECAVFGIPDDRWGEVPAAHVVLHGGVRIGEAALIAFLETRIARHKRPRFVKFVEHLPKTAVGKIQKNLIREPYWQGRERKI
jgi:acyl-CoA synthetase (AMP-forming)/AMP-acid ligase II